MEVTFMIASEEKRDVNLGIAQSHLLQIYTTFCISEAVHTCSYTFSTDSASQEIVWLRR